jgi:hypothetical protein
MKPVTTRAAVLGACLLAATPAAATEVGLRLDLGYLREDVWSSTVDDTGTRLDFNLAGDASGSLLAPGTVDWSLGAELKRLRERPIGGGRFDDDGLRFRGQVGLLREHTSPVSLVLFGERSQDDFTTQNQASSTGTILGTTYGAQAAYRGGEVPSLQLGFLKASTENTGFGRATTSDDLQLLTAGTRYAGAAYAVSLDYRLEQRDGSYASQNYDNHVITLNGSVNLGPETVATVTDRYYLRSPTLLAATNPGYEDHGLIAMVTWSRDRTRSQTRYLFDGTSIEAPTVTTRQQVVNTLSELYETPLSPELRLTSTLAVTSRDSVLGSTAVRTYGESATSILAWERRSGDFTWLAQGGGSLALLQGSDAGDGGWGVQAEAGLERAWTASRLSARYAFNYLSNMDAAAGWAFHHAITLDGSANPGPDLLLQANLVLSSDRIDSAVFGAGATRLIQLRSSAHWRRYVLDLQAGLTSGVLGSPTPISGDGLFVPAPFDTQSAFVSLGVTAPIGQAWSLYGRTRRLRLTSPDRAPQDEFGAQAGVTFSVGALVISLDEEYVEGGALLPSGSQNRVFIRLTRVFGARF